MAGNSGSGPAWMRSEASVSPVSSGRPLENENPWELARIPDSPSLLQILTQWVWNGAWGHFSQSSPGDTSHSLKGSLPPTSWPSPPHPTAMPQAEEVGRGFCA